MFQGLELDNRIREYGAGMQGSAAASREKGQGHGFLVQEQCLAVNGYQAFAQGAALKPEYVGSFALVDAGQKPVLGNNGPVVRYRVSAIGRRAQEGHAQFASLAVRAVDAVIDHAQPQ